MQSIGTKVKQASIESSDSPTLAESAIAYAARGWAVFPLQPRGKTPITAHGCKDATSDIDVIAQWWTRTPNAKIGIATGGLSGIVVIDIDGECGKESFEAITEDNDLPETLTSATGGGGFHLIFDAGEEAIKNSQGTIGKGIDTRGDGGYIVAPPSVHESGLVYTFDDAGIEPAPLPDWLRPEHYKAKPQVAPQQPARPRQAMADDNRIERARAYLEAMPGAIQGQSGHNALLAAATAMVHGFELSETDALNLLWSEYNPRCSPQWDASNPKERRDFERKVSQASKLPHTQPRGWLLADAGSFSADDDEAIRHGGEIIAAIMKGNSRTRKESAAPDLSLVPMPAGELCENYPELRPIIIDGLMRETETCNIIAGSKVGKTFLGIDMALSVATGRPWLDRFTVAPGKVLYIDCELHRNTFAKRIRDVAQARGISRVEYAQAMDILSLRGQLRDIFELRSFFATIPAGKYRLIVLDALYRLIPKGIDENSNADMTQVYNAIDSYGEATNAGFVVVHHASKGGQGEKNVTDIGAGAGAISRAADNHLTLIAHEAEDDAVVVQGKARSFPPIKPFSLRWDFPTWTIADDLAPTVKGSRGRKEPEKKWTPEDFAQAFASSDPRNTGRIITDAIAAGIGENKARALLRSADAVGLIFKHGGGGNRPFMYSTEPQKEDESAG